MNFTNKYPAPQGSDIYSKGLVIHCKSFFHVAQTIFSLPELTSVL